MCEEILVGVGTAVLIVLGVFGAYWLVFQPRVPTVVEEAPKKEPPREPKPIMRRIISQGTKTRIVHVSGEEWVVTHLGTVVYCGEQARGKTHARIRQVSKMHYEVLKADAVGVTSWIEHSGDSSVFLALHAADLAARVADA